MAAAATTISDIERWMREALVIKLPVNKVMLALLHNDFVNPIAGYHGLPKDPVQLFNALLPIVNRIPIDHFTKEQKSIIRPRAMATYSTKFDVTINSALLKNNKTLPQTLKTAVEDALKQRNKTFHAPAAISDDDLKDFFKTIRDIVFRLCGSDDDNYAVFEEDIDECENGFLFPRIKDVLASLKDDQEENARMIQILRTIIGSHKKQDKEWNKTRDEQLKDLEEMLTVIMKEKVPDLEGRVVQLEGDMKETVPRLEGRMDKLEGDMKETVPHLEGRVEQLEGDIKGIFLQGYKKETI